MEQFSSKTWLFGNGCRPVASVHYHFTPRPSYLNDPLDFTMTCRRMISLHTLSGMLETRCLSSPCSEGQPGLHCPMLSRPHCQLFGVCGVSDAPRVAVENPQFRHLLWGCGAALAAAENQSYCCGRQICGKSGCLWWAAGRGRFCACTKLADN